MRVTNYVQAGEFKYARECVCTASARARARVCVCVRAHTHICMYVCVFKRV